MWKRQLLGIALVTGLGLSGCVAGPGKVTGGGWLPSASGIPEEKAIFGFVAEQCDSDASGRYTYRDRAAPGFAGGVALNGAVVEATHCGLGTQPPDPSQPPDEFSPCNACVGFGFPEPFFPGFLFALGHHRLRVDYRSTNPHMPGEGEALVCVSEFVDLGGIFVVDGPYADYSNLGPVKGNIQRHDCP